VLDKNELPHDLITGITPDGAADGQCALGLILTLAEKVDTCQLHVLQRSVLFAVGLAGVTTKNAEANKLFKKHNRVVMLSRQSLAVGKGIREAQLSAKVPAHSLLTLERTATTRWGNQFRQLRTNCQLRLAIDPTVSDYKRGNIGNKEAIVETNESDQGTKAGTAVSAFEIGISSQDWEESQQMESFLSYPYDIKETIEKRGFCTGAQSMCLLNDLQVNSCHYDADLVVKEFPATLTVADRERSRQTALPADSLCCAVAVARLVMQEELKARLFTVSQRPSNWRLVQAFMSKQRPASGYLPEQWHSLGRTLYLQALRDAVLIARVRTRQSSPERAAKRQRVAPSGGMLFRGEDARPASVESPAAVPTDSDDFDPVLDETKRWQHLGREHYEMFFAPDGLLNEMAMMWALRERFPLHFVVFKQTASHIPHESNVEQVFSCAGLLSDPNLDPGHLATKVKIGVNKEAYTPPASDILDKYYEKFRGLDETEAEVAAAVAAEATAVVAVAAPGSSGS
jgi:hypothetical protein